MKGILLSIKREWWEKILSGEKTMEIRKSAPTTKKGIQWPVRVLCYISGTGEIQGEFMCHGWVKTNLVAAMAKQSCVPVEELEKYADEKSLYGWIVQEPRAYQEGIPLSALGMDKPPMSWCYLEMDKRDTRPVLMIGGEALEEKRSYLDVYGNVREEERITGL